ncbi:MAG: 2'-5' RNA ligase family protein [Cyanothece sp. SIO1E1]|nr:2'-5' RNA ligase family protein [Cyanothece sp. SIO1E1]
MCPECCQIKQHFSDRYASRAAQKSPPHITLQPPFQWPLETCSELQTSLRAFAGDCSAIEITLSGFGAFAPRVIYINVRKTPELLALQQALKTHLEVELGIVDPSAKQRPFAPHMTVAFRDLTSKNFRRAWPDFEHRQVAFTFVADQLTLLKHNGQRWLIEQAFAFMGH